MAGVYASCLWLTQWLSGPERGCQHYDVKVSAQDELRPGRVHAPETIKVYTVTVTRAAPASNNADLSDLTATAGPLSPAFAPATTSYTVNTPFSTTSTTVTPTAADAGATITVNAVPVASGSPAARLLSAWVTTS